MRTGRRGIPHLNRTRNLNPNRPFLKSEGNPGYLFPSVFASFAAQSKNLFTFPLGGLGALACPP